MSELIAHRHVAVLKVSEPRVLDEIRALLPLEDFVIARVSDTELVVDPARVPELTSRLTERGIVPLMKKAPPVEGGSAEESTVQLARWQGQPRR